MSEFLCAFLYICCGNRYRITIKHKILWFHSITVQTVSVSVELCRDFLTTQTARRMQYRLTLSHPDAHTHKHTQTKTFKTHVSLKLHINAAATVVSIATTVIVIACCCSPISRRNFISFRFASVSSLATTNV